MGIRRDTARIERAYLLDMLSGRGRILEVGCGDGRLTWHYAELAESVAGIDVTAGPLNEALRQRPEHLTETAVFCEASAVSLPFKSNCFDEALFSLSL